jgi:TM2 domain-containing membrane protein YozV
VPAVVGEVICNERTVWQNWPAAPDGTPGDRRWGFEGHTVSNSYYLAEGGAQRGPFAVDQLPAQGLRPDTLVWTEGMSQWLRADQVPAIRTMLPGAAAQPAPAEPQAAPYAPPVDPIGPGAPGAFAAPGAPAPMPYATPGQYPPGYGYPPPYAPTDSKKIAAGICGLLLGGFGVHKYILGLNSAGTIMLCCTLGSWIITLITCGIGAPLTLVMHVIGIIEGIIYLTKTDAEFYQLYVVQKKQWF